ncbi:MAG: aldo/keto reductase [Acidimicrobiales bacterium]|nr:aldo/keto reductase [Acidimicrobiales bacterium]
MTYRPLGDSGLMVSTVGLGCNNFGMRIDADATAAVVDAALDVGITLFDTADSYGTSEELLAPLLKGRRDRVVLATKFGSDLRGAGGPDWGARASRRYVRQAVERSLRRLDTDWIDLYQLHKPDGITPIEETLSVLTDLVHEGKVRYLGSSNLTAWQVADADWTATTAGLERFVSAQNEYSLLRTEAEAELVPACERFGIGILPYFPLASGLLTGKYRRGDAPPEGGRIAAWSMTGLLSDTNFDLVEALESFAAERDLTLLDVAMGGLAARPAVASVIAGATTPEQVRANAAAGLWEPTDDDDEALGVLTGRG